MYTYLLLNIGTLLFPLLLSFDRKVAFFRRWKALFPAIAITGAVFIAWDVWFTHMGVWGFAPEYLVGINLLNLPIEEWMFFFTVPYGCVFIYECLKAYVSTDWMNKLAQPIGWGLVAILLVVGAISLDKWYTSVTFFGLAAYLTYLLIQVRPTWLGRFWIAYLISLIPFFAVNGVLTALPVVWYNNAENLAIRLGSIPIEDSMYGLLLVLMNVSLMEWFLQNQKKTSKPELSPASTGS
jgi:lycopene cyclase domain-containing protein